MRCVFLVLGFIFILSITGCFTKNKSTDIVVVTKNLNCKQSFNGIKIQKKGKDVFFELSVMLENNDCIWFELVLPFYKTVVFNNYGDFRKEFDFVTDTLYWKTKIPVNKKNANKKNVIIKRHISFGLQEERNDFYNAFISLVATYKSNTFKRFVMSSSVETSRLDIVLHSKIWQQNSLLKCNKQKRFFAKKYPNRFFSFCNRFRVWMLLNFKLLPQIENFNKEEKPINL